MSFDRQRLPNPLDYFESEGLKLVGRGKWRTTSCGFHGGSDSMRVNVVAGGWCCMNCGAKGGDVLEYHRQLHHLEFTDAARALGAWIDDSNSATPHQPTPLPARAALQVLAFEATFTAVAAANVANGVPLTTQDKGRLMTAAARINRIAELFS